MLQPMLAATGGNMMGMDIRYVRIFRNGRNQAVRIPREFELAGSEAIMRKDGDRLIIEPVKSPPLRELLMQWDPLAEALPPIDDLPPEPVDLD